MLDTVNKLDPLFSKVKAVESVDTDAVTVPVAIWDRFKPTTPDAGTLVNPDPSPENDPETPLVTIKEPVISESVLTLNLSSAIDAV